MGEKVETLDYMTFDDLAADFNLMCSNAMKYNPP